MVLKMMAEDPPPPPPDSKFTPEEWNAFALVASQQLISMLDANGDGIIQWSEFVNAVNKEVLGCSDEASAKAKIDAEIPFDKVPLFIEGFKKATK